MWRVAPRLQRGSFLRRTIPLVHRVAHSLSHLSMALASAPAFNPLLKHLLAFLIPRSSILESLNLAGGIGAGSVGCTPSENRHGSARGPRPCPTPATVANCWRSPAFRLADNQALKTSSAMPTRAAIPPGVITAKRQGRRPPALTSFVYMHKGCTPDSPASSAVLPRGLRDRGWPTGYGL